MLNEKIVAYLSVNNITFTVSDYSTMQPEGQPDQIFSWNTEKLGVQPTEAQLDAAYPIWEGQQNKASNKSQAEQLLQQTDWVEIPSVSDIANTPHLVNYADFITYRLALRTIAVNPPVTVQEWPVKPDEIWSE